MKTLIIITILSQLVLMPYFVYIIRNGYWNFSFCFFRQTFHFILLILLVIFNKENNFNLAILAAYFAINLEELMNIRTFDALANMLFNKKGSDAEIHIVENNFIDFYWTGIKIDIYSTLTILINLIDTKSLFDIDQKDPVCASAGQNMSIIEILLHPGNHGHEYLKMLALGMLIL